MRSRDEAPIYPLDLFPQYESCQRELAILAIHIAAQDFDEAVRRLVFCFEDLKRLRSHVKQLQEAIHHRYERDQAERKALAE